MHIEWLTKKVAWTEEVETFKREVSLNMQYFKPKINMKYSYGYTTRLLSDFKDTDLKIEQKSNGTVQAYYREHENAKWKYYWVYLENNVCFSKKPELVTIGFLNFLKMDDIYVEMSPFNNQAYRMAEIRMDKDICFLGNKEVLFKPLSKYWRKHYYIYRRYADGKRFVLSENKDVKACDTLYDLYYDGDNPPIFKKHIKP